MNKKPETTFQSNGLNTTRKIVLMKWGHLWNKSKATILDEEILNNVENLLFFFFLFRNAEIYQTSNPLS
jgi:hypothetical protein